MIDPQLHSQESLSASRPGWRYRWLLLMIVAILGIALELYLTRNDPGVSGDAVHYMEGARNILAGKGYSRMKADGTAHPLTGFPPGFSLSMSAIGLTGMAPLDASRYLNSFLFGANIFLVGLILLKLTRSIPISLSGSLITLTFISLVKIHSWVMSEPLFIFLTLLSLLSFIYYWEKGNWVALILTGFLIGLSTITRYIGLVLPLVISGAILFLSQKPWRRRLAEILVLAGVIAVPVGSWLIRNLLVANTLTNRVLVYHGLSYSLVVTLLDEISSWLFPNELHLSWRVRIILFMIFVIGTASYSIYLLYRQYTLKKQKQIGVPGALMGLLTLYFPFYISFLVINATILDATSDDVGNRRYLLPVFTLGVIWVFGVYQQLGWNARTRQVLQGVSVVAACCLIGLYAVRTIPFIQNPGYALGYTDTKNRNDEVVQALRAIDPKQAILTNDYEFVYFITGRPPYTLPADFDQANQTINENFDQDLNSMRVLLQEGAILVAFKKGGQFTPAVNELIPDLTLLQAYRDASFFIGNGSR